MRHAAYMKAALDGDSLASGSGHGSCGQLVRNVELALAHASTANGRTLGQIGRVRHHGCPVDSAVLEKGKLNQLLRQLGGLVRFAQDQNAASALARGMRSQ
jgi:hypothetical protein